MYYVVFSSKECKGKERANKNNKMYTNMTSSSFIAFYCWQMDSFGTCPYQYWWNSDFIVPRFKLKLSVNHGKCNQRQNMGQHYNERVLYGNVFIVNMVGVSAANLLNWLISLNDIKGSISASHFSVYWLLMGPFRRPFEQRIWCTDYLLRID